MKSAEQMLIENDCVSVAFRAGVCNAPSVPKCEFCGAPLVGDNRVLSNDCGLGEILTFGCSKCIEKPLGELNIPPMFDLSSQRAKEAFNQYRRAIADAERKKGRL